MVPCPRAKLLGAVGYPPRVSRKGKAPPLERGKGKYSPPANPERVTAKALKRGDKGSFSPSRWGITIFCSLSKE
jgi:hypothetical protein